jgi:hypothetical protein
MLVISFNFTLKLKISRYQNHTLRNFNDLEGATQNFT